MILNRVIVDGKVIYKEIGFDAAVALEDKTGLIFTDEDEKDDFYDYLDELAAEDDEIDEDDDDDYEEVEIDEEDDETIAKKADKFAKKLERKFNDLGKKLEERLNKEEIKETFSSIASFFKDNTYNPKSKANKIVKMMPFMDPEDIHDVVLNIIDGKEDYKDINLVTILPFLTTDDCDLLFIDAIEKGVKNKVLKAMAPFVSETCLSKFVDEYVKGKYSYVNIDNLYPFMAPNDIKKVFKYVINKDKEDK